MDSEFALPLPPWQLWLLAGVLLGAAEALIPGVYLVWIGAAALVTGTLSWLFMPDDVGLQLGLFALCILAALYIGRKAYARDLHDSDDPLLNHRTERLVGRLVTVSQDIVHGEGRVNVDDGSWRATGPDAPAGTTMIVLSAEGTVLTVGHPPA